MITIPSAVEEIIKTKPFLESALVDGLINLSALARQLKPLIEDRTNKPINEGAIVMALNRLVPRLTMISNSKINSVVKNIGDIIVRSDLTDITYANSKTLFEKEAKLLESIKDKPNIFCTFSQGVDETTIIISSAYASETEEHFKGENLLSKQEKLSSITVKLPASNVYSPGIYYFIFKKLAWEDVNVLEVISTSNEYTIVVDDKDIDVAFSVLMSVKRTE
ncbi:MAG: aspartate kinase [Bacteroidetes bacterium]|nr:aspartate kinase [Bacteroidota bacterium]